MAILEDEKFFNQECIDNYNSEYQQYLDGAIMPPYLGALTEKFDQNYGGFSFYIYNKNNEKKLTKEAFTFAKFLVECLDGMDFQSYLEAVETNVVRDVIQLKRKPWESRINNYNKYILKAWRANCDLQFILDPYGAVVYTTNYIVKGPKDTTVAVCLLYTSPSPRD